MLKCLYFMPTLNCNCRCTYCYIPDKKYNSILTEQDYCQIIDKYKKYSAGYLPYPEKFQLRFTGGEPYLTSPLVEDLSNYFLSQFPQGLVVINTNGTLINEQNLSRFNGKFKSSLVHVLSVDSIEKIHNIRRPLVNGQNSFEKTIQAFNLLQHQQYPVYINSVIDQQTCDYIDEFFYYLKSELRTGDISISLRQDSTDSLSRNTKFNFLTRIYKLASQFNIRVSGHHRLLLGNQIPELKCQAGKTTAVITSQARVYPCQRFVGTDVFKSISTHRLDFKRADNFTDIQPHCYSPDNLWLGEKLFELYEKHYPYYLKINELDRILFGVVD
ncbi:MAG: hypothetical protein APR63_08750 [Desulfuromonas sp. SDB]|nr:MAG: hypothetical protein APR63_08750 [Desulfuromonas sp. SDB]